MFVFWNECLVWLTYSYVLFNGNFNCGQVKPLSLMNFVSLFINFKTDAYCQTARSFTYKRCKFCTCRSRENRMSYSRYICGCKTYKTNCTKISWDWGKFDFEERFASTILTVTIVVLMSYDILSSDRASEAGTMAVDGQIWMNLIKLIWTKRSVIVPAMHNSNGPGLGVGYGLANSKQYQYLYDGN